jgi:hypothetical protein
MKKLIFFISFVMISFIGETQVKKTTDPSEICIPYDVAQKMLLDLNEYDKLKDLSKLDKKEIYQLNSKINFLEKTNDSWQVKDSLSVKIITQTEEKVKIYKQENEDLKKENKRLKIKNGLFNIVSAVIIAPLTYIAIFK